MESRPPSEGSRRRRNQLLDSYYGLSPSSSQPPLSHTSPATLIQSLPLARLLTSPADVRDESASLTTTLQTTTKQTYDRLSAAYDAACTAAETSQNLLGQLERTANGIGATTERARAANERLSEVRERLRKQEGMRKVVMVQKAGKTLPEALKRDYLAVVELCTDPDAAVEKLVVTSRRFASLMPLMEELGSCSEHFQDLVRRMSEAAKDVKVDIEKRLSHEDEADGDFMPISTAIRVWKRLGGKDEIIKMVFLNSSRKMIEQKAPTEAALANHGSRPLSVAGCYVSFATDVILPLIDSTLADLQSTLDSQRSEEEEVFLQSWQSEILGRKIIQPVEECLSRPDIWSLTDGEDASAFRESVNRLRAYASSSSDTKTLVARCCDSIESKVQEKLQAGLESLMWQEAEKLLSKSYIGESDEGGAGAAGSHRVLQEDVGLFGKIFERERLRFQKLVSVLASENAALMDEAKQRLISRLSSLKRAHVVSVNLLQELKAGQTFLDTLLKDYSARRAGEIGGLLADCVLIRSPLPQRVSVSKQAREACRRIEVVKLEISMMSNSENATSYMSHGLFSGSHLLDDDRFGLGAVFNQILRRWIAAIREQAFDDEGAVHSIQLDAAAVARVMGINTESVVQAAIDQCSVDVVLLDENEIKQANPEV